MRPVYIVRPPVHGRSSGDLVLTLLVWLLGKDAMEMEGHARRFQGAGRFVVEDTKYARRGGRGS